jgi:hypothetical protein
VAELRRFACVDDVIVYYARIEFPTEYVCLDFDLLAPIPDNTHPIRNPMETQDTMNGAESLVKTLLACGVDTCFANPGTSEMHFVAALDRIPGMRCVLGLFEGVVTGAADGYARMADKPAATLLHCGPGWPTAWPTCTTRAARRRRSSTSSAIRPRITARSTRR